MKDEDKSRDRIIKELEELRRRVIELEGSKTVLRQAGETSSDSGTRCASSDIKRNEWEVILNLFPDFIMILDDQYRIVVINKAMAHGLGVTPKDAIGKRCYELVHGGDKPPEFCPHSKLLEDGREHMEEIYEENLGGFCIVSVSPLYDTRGRLTGSLHIARDINARKLAEKALRESEEKYRVVVENANEAIMVAQDGMHKFFNRKALEISGYTEKEFSARPFVKVIHPDDRHMVLEHHRKRLKGEDIPHIYPFRIIDKNGKEKWIEINAILIDWEGKPATLNFMTDITKRKHAEDALRESEERMRAIFEAAENVSLVMTDLAGTDARVLEFSPGAERMFGYRCDEIIGKPAAMLHLPEDVASFPKIIKAMGQGKAGFAGESTLVRKSGERFPALFTSYPIFDGKGRMTATLGVAIDVSERVGAEKELRKSEEKYHSIFENIQDVYYEVTLDGKILEISPSIERISRYKREELIGKSAYDIYFKPKKRDEFVKKVLKNKRVTGYEVILKDKDGSKAYCSTSAKLAYDKQGNPEKLIGSFHNITKRKKIEKSLRESEKTLKAILEASPVGIGLVRHRTLDWANKAMYRMLGYEENSLLGESARVLYPDDEEYDRIGRELYAGIDATGIGNVETRWIKKDGSVINCFLQARTLVPSDPEKVIILASMDITDQKKSEEYIHTLTHELMKAQEDERTMISRELHDRVAQDLSVSKIGCDMVLKNQPALPPEVKQKIIGVSNGLQGAINAIRDLSYELRPPGLDQIGLAETIFQYCEEFSEKTGLNVDFTFAGMDGLKLDFNTEINLYRLVQEGLNNTWKHADASHVTIRLAAAHPNIILRINDDGKGFDVKERLANALNEKRMGLRSMEERVHLLQGDIEIQSQPMQGTKISIKFPYAT